MRKTRYRFIVLLLASLTFSCVPKRQFVELEMKNERTVLDRDSLKAVNAALTVANTELKSELSLMRSIVQQERDKLSEQIDSIRFYRSQYNVLKSINNDLSRRLEEISSGVESENRQMLTDLMRLKEELISREEKLRKLEDSLSIERRNLTMMKSRLDDKNQVLAALDSLLRVKEQNLAEQGKKIAEMQTILDQKDRAVRDLKEKVARALVGFEKEGLQVEYRNGKVYVSMAEKLLFKSGSYTVDTRGRDALKRLSDVLAENRDINIMVEGHTDDVPFKGHGELKDNWDLSVKRATSVVRVLLENKNVSPERISAAGRGEFMPLEQYKTPEARAKNRRTEIILTPKLDELLKLLESN